MNEKFCILNRISLKFIPKGLIDNESALVQLMARRRRRGDKPLLEAMLTQFADAYMRHKGVAGVGVGGWWVGGWLLGIKTA